MNDVLGVLFGSKFKVRIMRFFLLNPENEYSVAEIAKKNMIDKEEVRKELNGFEKIKFVSSKIRKRKKYYKVNKSFPFYLELEKLILRSNVFPECTNVKKLREIGSVKLILASGVFLNYPKSRIDLLIVVDNVSKIKLRNLMNKLEAEVGKEIRYMVLSSEELNYRLDMLDRFLIGFFRSPYDVIINKIPKFKSIVANIGR